LISTVGQWQLPAQPSLNKVYEEPGLSLFLIDVGDGEIQFHADIQGEITLSRMKHFDKVFWTLIALLADKGMTSLTTWVNYGDDKQKRMAEFFGFETTGFMKFLELEDGQERTMAEMLLVFPLEDETE